MKKKNLYPISLILLFLLSGYSPECFGFLTELDIHKIREKMILAKKEELAAKIKEAPPQNVKRGPENPFHGWWQQISRGNNRAFGFGSGTDDTDSYIFIDTDAAPFITISSLAGTPQLPRERTNLDGTILFPFYYQPNADSLVHIFDLDGPLFDPTGGESYWSLKLQPDGQTLAASPESRPYFVGYDSTINFYRKIDEPQQPVRPFNDTDAAFPDVTDPVEIARQIYNSQTYNQNQAQNINFKDGDYRSFYERQQIFGQIINEGIEVKTSIRRVRVSRPGEHFIAPVFVPGFTTQDFATDIFTEHFSLATVGSTVEIGGFEGPWACLNGIYPNGVAWNEEGAVPNPSPTHLDVCSTDNPCKKGTWCNVFNHFLLHFDSSDPKKFPCDHLGYAKFCGKPWVKVKHHITSDMEYPAFVAAVNAMFYTMYRVSMHNWFIGYLKPNSIYLIDSWQDLQQAVPTNNFRLNFIFTRFNQNTPSGFFNNPSLTARLITTYNDPFGLTQQPNSKYDYNIVMANYIKNAKTLYWAIEGTPDLTPVAPNGQPIQFDPVTIGYKPAIPGPERASFVGKLGDITVVDGKPVPQNPDPTFFTIAGTNPNLEVQNANSYYIGLIDTKLTKGKKIGYLHWKDENQLDPFGFMLGSTFAPNVPVTVKYSREAVSKVYSNFTRFFNEQGCDAVILDIRTNNGGQTSLIYGLAEFFGWDRAAMIRGYSSKDNGNSALINFQDFSFFQNFFSVYTENFERFYVSQNEQNYPGSVFRGSQENPKKVVVLTDSAAVSAGDVFPHFFLGEHLDGNLGSFTTGVIIGDIDGRLKGATGVNNPPPVSQDSNRLYDMSGNPFPPIRFAEDFANGIRLNGLTDIWYNQQSNLVAPIKAPTLRGLAGGAPLPNDWENNVWPALGLIKAPKGLFNDKIPKKKPCSNDRKTWRDPWLEQAILEACGK